jgi:hypothetical protein
VFLIGITDELQRQRVVSGCPVCENRTSEEQLLSL